MPSGWSLLILRRPIGFLHGSLHDTRLQYQTRYEYRTTRVIINNMNSILITRTRHLQERTPFPICATTTTTIQRLLLCDKLSLFQTGNLKDSIHESSRLLLWQIMANTSNLMQVFHSFEPRIISLRPCTSPVWNSCSGKIEKLNFVIAIQVESTKKHIAWVLVKLSTDILKLLCVYFFLTSPSSGILAQMLL